MKLTNGRGVLMLKTLRREMLCINVKNTAVKCRVLMLKTLRGEMPCINVKNTTR